MLLTNDYVRPILGRLVRIFTFFVGYIANESYDRRVALTLERGQRKNHEIPTPITVWLVLGLCKKCYMVLSKLIEWRRKFKVSVD